MRRSASFLIMRHTPSRRLIRVGTLSVLVLMSATLSGCGAVGGFVGDALPAWAGGLPADAPPRPSDPRYAEYERSQRAKTIIDAPADAGTVKAETPKPEPAK